MWIWVCLSLWLEPGRPGATECQDEWPEHPEWVFCHDFEAADSDNLGNYFNDIYGAPERTFLIDDNPSGVPGSRALRTQIVNNTDQAFESGVTSGPKKFLVASPDWQALYFRKYLRFNAEFVQGNFMHLGGMSACRADLWPWGCMGGAGGRPDGDTNYSSNLEPWSAYQSLPWPGRWGFYSYYHEMYMDCGQPGPDDCYGDMFAPETNFFVSRGDWHVLEMVIVPNTPGETNGYQSFWADGQHVYTSPDINWRTDANLRPNLVGLYLYIHNVPAQTTDIVDWDNVVISRDYIGPTRCQDDALIQAACLCGGLPDPLDSANVAVNGYCCDGSWQSVPCSDQPDAGTDADADGGVTNGDDGGLPADDGGVQADDGGVQADDGSVQADDGSVQADDGQETGMGDDGGSQMDDEEPVVSGGCACHSRSPPGVVLGIWLAMWWVLRIRRKLV